MQERHIYSGLTVASLGCLFLLQLILGSRGLAACRGDIDGDEQITAADLSALLPLIADDGETDPATPFASDVNGDGAINASDITALISVLGMHCAAATPTQTPTPRRSPPTSTQSPTPTFTPGTPQTATPSRTATDTRTPTVSPTPTAICVMQQAVVGTPINGELTTSDCQRSFGSMVRYSDLYTISGTPGQAIKVTVTATGPTPGIAPLIAVTDADGQFGTVLGPSPIEFIVTTAQPYQILVASNLSSRQLGPYKLTLSTRTCPAPVPLVIPSSRIVTLAGTECPLVGSPSVGANSNPQDVYTFQVPSVPKNISIVMQQVNPDDDLWPVFSVLGPDGLELVSQIEDFDCTSYDADVPLNCAEVRFLALQTGTYTIIAGGGIGKYSLQMGSPICHVTALTGIPPDRPLTCAGQTSPGCSGSLSGDPRVSCSAPLPIPGVSDDQPRDPVSPADLYTFTAAAGDVISIGMSSDDDAHLYLLGPAPGNALVAQDDNSNGTAYGDAQLAATLPVPGTYTIVAANNNAVSIDDPINYTLFVQKCPVEAGFSLAQGGSISGTFSEQDCLGFGGIPFKSYAFTGAAGQFVTAAMTSSDVDAFVRMWGPDGSVVQNDDDVFDSSNTDARVNRILPVDGTYVVEVSSSLQQPAVELTPPLPAFSLEVHTCPVTTVVPGAVSGAFTDADCELASGQKFDVFTFATATVPRAVTVVPPAGTCMAGLLAEGPQVPDGGCTGELLELPVLTPNQGYGFIIAAPDATTRGAYTAHLSSCPLATVGFGDVRSGALTASTCTNANGSPAAWFLVRAPADVVWFNFGITGVVSSSFNLAGVLTDVEGASNVEDGFADDPSTMYGFGADVAALLRVAGATAADQGSYTVSVEVASLRQ